MLTKRDIINSFTQDEIDASQSTKFTVKISIEYLLATEANFSTAIRLASLVLESCNNEIYPTEEFRNKHPENRIEVYSSKDVWLAFYMLMLAEKAENLFNIYLEEQAERIEIICKNDHETCSLCKEMAKEIDLPFAKYSAIPPHHVGCRCGIIFRK